MTLKLAKFLISEGVSIVPLAGKAPRMEWKRLQTEQLNGNEVNQWFGATYSTVGLITGRQSGFVVVDADDADAVALVRDHCPFTQMTRQTARGAHFYYRWPDYAIPNAAGLLGAKIDVRGDGGYVVIKRNLTCFSRELPIYDPAWLGQ